MKKHTIYNIEVTEINKARREKLHLMIDTLDKVVGALGNVLNEEQMALDNLPDGLADSERASKMDDAIDSMESAIAEIEMAQDFLRDAAV